MNDLNDHWLAKSRKVDQNAIRKTADFEKNKNKLATKKIRKAFRGKDKLVNFLFKAKQLDKTLARSLELERDEFRRYVKQMDKEYKKMKTKKADPDADFTRKEIREFRKTTDNDFGMRTKLPVSSVQQKIQNSNLPRNIKASLSFHSHDHIAAKNLDILMSIGKGKLKNFDNPKQLLEYLKREGSLNQFMKLLNDSPEGFEIALMGLDDWKTSMQGSAPTPEHLQTKLRELGSHIDLAAPKNLQQLEASSEPSLWKKTKLRYNIDETFGEWAKRTATSTGRDGQTGWVQSTKDYFANVKSMSKWKKTKWLGGVALDGLNVGMQIAGLVMCSIQIHMARTNEETIETSIREQEKELEETRSTLNSLLDNSTSTFSNLFEKYKNMAKILEQEFIMYSRGSMNAPSVLQVIHKTLDQTITEDVLQGKDFGELINTTNETQPFNETVGVMVRYNSALSDNLEVLQEDLKSAYRRREIENGALEGRDLAAIKKSMVDNNWASSNITEFDMLTVLAATSREDLSSLDSYEGFPLACVREWTSQEDLVAWKTQNEPNLPLEEKLRHFLEVKLPIEMMLRAMRNEKIFTGTDNDFLGVIASKVKDDTYVDMMGTSTDLVPHRSPGSGGSC